MVYCSRLSFKKDLFSITLKEFSRLHYCSFVKVLCCCCSRQLSYINTLICLCQQLFKTFLKTFSALCSSHETYNRFSLFVFHCLATALLDYHVVSFLSTTFLNNLTFFILTYWLKNRSVVINTSYFLSVDKTEKEGFEPSRRVNDLYP